LRVHTLDNIIKNVYCNDWCLNINVTKTKVLVFTTRQADTLNRSSYLLLGVNKRATNFATLSLEGGKNFALCVTKNINILTLVLSEKKFLIETKKTYPPFKLSGQSLTNH
jgi:hypothetical protein